MMEGHNDEEYNDEEYNDGEIPPCTQDTCFYHLNIILLCCVVPGL